MATAANPTKASTAGGGAPHPPLDFAALLSRDYRPARVSQLVPRERSSKELVALRNNKRRPRGGSFDTSAVAAANASTKLGDNGGANDDDVDDDDDDDDAENENDNQKKSDDLKRRHHRHHWTDEGGEPLLMSKDNRTGRTLQRKSKEEVEDETARLVLQLVSKTPTYTRHLQQEEATKVVDDSELQTYIRRHGQHKQSSQNKHDKHGAFAPSFHQVELADWESNIQWKGYQDPNKKQSTDSNSSNGGTNATAAAAAANDSSSNKPEAMRMRMRMIRSVSPNAVDAASLLQKRRNPFLEDLDFGDMVSWSGSKEDTAHKANQLPLILELGVAGQSIARHALPSHRPIPCIKSDEYQQRMESEWEAGGDNIQSTAERFIAIRTKWSD
jgi:hypothetical protein